VDVGEEEKMKDILILMNLYFHNFFSSPDVNSVCACMPISSAV
jgi:hypothetical protein